MLPTFAVICCTGFAAAGKVGSFNFGMLLHGSVTFTIGRDVQPARSSTTHAATRIRLYFIALPLPLVE